ncbi:MAG: nucleoside triphosphate pyrophosphohydrolase ham1 [Caeruleum heppii]|nr:MAG: nucleoside triphosphate pyrophosphohydrolase ham1 [Caeruleum heppii]
MPSIPRTLDFISSNPHKVGEVRAILSDGLMGIELRSQALDLVEIQAVTVEEVSGEKCRAAAAKIDGAVLTEDTCLGFDALGGLPGPYVKWFLQNKSVGLEGLNNLLAAYDDKSAEAVCTFAYSAGPGHEPIIFQGRTRGKIVPARGPTDFGVTGWDSIFEVDGKTYAEMGKAEKNQISHRSKALAKLKEWLRSEPSC